MGNVANVGMCQEECHTCRNELQRDAEHAGPHSMRRQPPGVPFDQAWRPSKNAHGGLHGNRLPPARHSRERELSPGPKGRLMGASQQGKQRAYTMFENPYNQCEDAGARAASMYANPYNEHYGLREAAERSYGSRGGHGPQRARGNFPPGYYRGGPAVRQTRSRPPAEAAESSPIQQGREVHQGFNPRAPDFNSRAPDFAADMSGLHPPSDDIQQQIAKDQKLDTNLDETTASDTHRCGGVSPRVEDTLIGKGFGEFLKRGVAQAVPAKEEGRTEMVPSKDGGFIATIQKGFEGIFGHLANSKEEVLKKRGPMIAPEYEAVPGDDIDQRVEFYAKQLPKHQGECLNIYRVERARYKIGTDEVRLAWQQRINPPSNQAPAGSVSREVFVFTVDDKKTANESAESSAGVSRATSNASTAIPRPGRSGQAPSEALPLFLRHSANIAYDLQFGNNGLSQVPEGSRLSFAEETGTLLENSDANAKWNAMNIATAQAKKREQYAKELIKKKKADDVMRQSSVESRVEDSNAGRDTHNPPCASMDTEVRVQSKGLPDPPPQEWEQEQNNQRQQQSPPQNQRSPTPPPPPLQQQQQDNAAQKQVHWADPVRQQSAPQLPLWRDAQQEPQRQQSQPHPPNTQLPQRMTSGVPLFGSPPLLNRLSAGLEPPSLLGTPPLKGLDAPQLKLPTPRLWAGTGPLNSAPGPCATSSGFTSSLAPPLGQGAPLQALGLQPPSGLLHGLHPAMMAPPLRS